jgi:phosphoribosylanthranilate isomerase
MTLQLKVCGMRDAANIAEIAATNPQWMGFIFYPQSKRYVGTDFDKNALATIPANIHKVGVFVNETIDGVIEKVHHYNLQTVQLHGDEDIYYTKELRGKLNAETQLIKAFGINELFNFNTIAPFTSICDYFLFDTKVKGYGGSSEHFDWCLLEKYQHTIPYFLSGGIGPADIAAIIKIKHQGQPIFAIDVNSKVELEPGIKDVLKVKELTIQLL